MILEKLFCKILAHKTKKISHVILRALCCFTATALGFWQLMYVYDSINTVYVRLCTLMTIVMSFTVSDSHKPNSGGYFSLIVIMST